LSDFEIPFLDSSGGVRPGLRIRLPFRCSYSPRFRASCSSSSICVCAIVHFPARFARRGGISWILLAEVGRFRASAVPPPHFCLRLAAGVQIQAVSPYFFVRFSAYLGAELISPHLSAAVGRIPCPDSGGNQWFGRLLTAPIWAELYASLYPRFRTASNADSSSSDSDVGEPKNTHHSPAKRCFQIVASHPPFSPQTKQHIETNRSVVRWPCGTDAMLCLIAKLPVKRG
jgi:hypothetical protein